MPWNNCIPVDYPNTNASLQSFVDSMQILYIKVRGYIINKMQAWLRSEVKQQPKKAI